MIYVGFLLLALTLEAIFRFSVLNNLKPLTDFLHFHCLQRINASSNAAPELAALVCAENFSQFAQVELFMASGLIHLFVVSGAHLIVLEKIIKAGFLVGTNRSKLYVLCILLIYALACEMNPPVSRSLLAIAITFLLTRQKLLWTENFRILVTGLLCLCLNPDWLSSVSLQLSWVAALVVSIHHVYFSGADRLLKQFLFFILLGPLLIFFQVPSPAVLVTNILLTPVLEFFLFPLGLLTWLFPFLSAIFEKSIFFLKFVLQLFEFKQESQQILTGPPVVLVGWIFILGLHFFLHFTEMKRRWEWHV